ncbi:hypothetical protein HAX54_002736 [Datura stramonium]|uniref:Uncharacterized protein n=1 Tax=Datura stramonium TaxID=4076 RepID=A0ABS8T5C0_DATST|nr:hypothetical protein [Datura stramonium]
MRQASESNHRRCRDPYRSMRSYGVRDLVKDCKRHLVFTPTHILDCKQLFIPFQDTRIRYSNAKRDSFSRSINMAGLIMYNHIFIYHSLVVANIMANNDQQLNSNRANNEQVPLEPQEFDQRNARKQIPNDVNESDEEDHRNDINSGALNLEKMIKMLVSTGVRCEDP